MTTRAITRIAAGALALTLIGVGLWHFSHGHAPTRSAKQPSAAAKRAAPAAEIPAVAATPPAAAPKPLPPQQAEEVAATARMYLAHAPLRTPEVADPDSAANRQVLQAMVLKALAQPAHAPPVASAIH